VRISAGKMLGLGRATSREELAERGELWRPYRSTASLWLWAAQGRMGPARGVPVSSTSRGRLLVSSVLLLTGVGVWLGFIAVRNELLNTGGLLQQIALPFLTVGLLMAAAWFYRAARQSQAGFWIAAILLVGMAAYTFWPWYWTASTILTLGAVSVLVAGLASKGMRREQPRGDESTDQAGDPVTQEQATAISWRGCGWELSSLLAPRSS